LLEDEYLLNSFKDMLVKNDLLKQTVTCRARHGKELSLPSDEYALIRGPEILIECDIAGFKGHAFSPCPTSYEGFLGDLNNVKLDNICLRGFSSLFLMLC